MILSIASAEIGVKFLTLYAFSTENWDRPKSEINALMSLLVAAINKETKTLMDNNIKLSQTITFCVQNYRRTLYVMKNINSKVVLIRPPIVSKFGSISSSVAPPASAPCGH